jgi:hypothetical protein
MHEDCKDSGTILNAAGGHVSRSYLAETAVYTNLDLTLGCPRELGPDQR